MKVHFIAACLVGLAAPAAEAATTFSVSVNAHQANAISKAEVDTLLGKVDKLFANNAAKGVAHCNVKFKRNGGIDVFPSGWGSVVDKGLGNYKPNDHTVSVFSQITYCDGPALPGFRLLGCARHYGPVTAIRHTREHLIWAHEMGHGQGLDHNPATGYLMYVTIAADSQAMTEKECKAFETGQDLPAMEAIEGAEPKDMAAAERVEGSEPKDMSATPPDVEQMLDELWIDELPIDRIRALDEAGIEVARDAIRNKVFARWENALVILGLRGNEADFSLIEEVLRQPVEVRDSPSPIVDAKAVAPLALSYLTYRVEKKEGVAMLETLLDPEAAAELTDLGVEGTGYGAVRPVVVNAAIGTAIVAAANEGMRSRMNVIRSRVLSSPLTSDIGDRFFDDLGLLANAVRKQGLEGYLKNGAAE